MTHVLQNVVFPLERDPDLLPLYADPEIWSVIDEQPVRVSSRAHLGNILDRRRARIVELAIELGLGHECEASECDWQPMRNGYRIISDTNPSPRTCFVGCACNVT